MPVIISKNETSNKVKSVMKFEKSVFNVTSYFEKTASLVDILLATANEIIFQNPSLGSDTP